MYKFYMVSDATTLESHAQIFEKMVLFFDPYAESDAYALIEPKMKEEPNKAESLEFMILPGNIHYADIQKRKTVVLAFDDDSLVFEGVVVDAPIDFFKQRKVTCSSVLAYLCDSIQAPDEKNSVEIPTASGEKYYSVPETWYSGSNPSTLNWYERSIDLETGEVSYTLSKDKKVMADKDYYRKVVGDGKNHSGNVNIVKSATKETISEHIIRLLGVHNSQVDPFKRILPGQIVKDSEKKEFKTSNFRPTWDALKNDIIDNYGRYIRIRRGNDNNNYLDYLNLSDMESGSTPLIEFAHNMIEMGEANNSDSDIFTVLVPIGKNNMTIEKLTGHDSPAHSGDTTPVDPYVVKLGDHKRYVVVSRNAIKKFGYIMKTESFGDISDVNKLWTKAVEYIKNNYDYHSEYEVKAIDLKFIGENTPRKIELLDKCRIYSRWHNVDESDLYVISIEHDFLNPENDAYKIGMPTSDKDASNKRLSGQSSSTKAKAAGGVSAANNAINDFANKLSALMDIDEWGIHAETKIENLVASEDGRYKTKFQQTDRYFNLSAAKLFGYDEKDAQDAGYDLVPKEDYIDNVGRLKNPKAEAWFKKNSEGIYVLATEEVADINVDYYERHLWERYANLEVGVDGIKGRVDGNYARSVASSSWISANEDSILALTGHIHINDKGEVVIDSAAGASTGYKKPERTHTYVAVRRSSYEGNPASNDWYEQKTDATGAWLGQDKADRETNDSYYKKTTDTTPVISKQYYTLQTMKETFVAQYGIYDQGNLTAGVLARSINYPNYKLISKEDLVDAKNRDVNPHTQGWWEYEPSVGRYGQTKDEEVDLNPEVKDGVPLKYYTVDNNMVNFTNIMGDHIVIGGKVDENGNPVIFEGKSEKDIAKIRAYIDNHNLDGTITEIASDVVSVNALFAAFLYFSEAEGESIDITARAKFAYAHANELDVSNASNDASAHIDVLNANSVSTQYVTSDTITIDGVIFGDDGEGYSGTDPRNIVVGFGEVTTSGDTVTIPYLTAEDDGVQNANKKLSFNKPASLGSVTWSSGNYLKALTVGGVEFLSGRIGNYVPSGQSEAQQMINARYLDGETSGYDQVYGLYYKTVGVNGSLIEHKTMLFKTPKDRYNDGREAGWEEAEKEMDWPTAMQGNGERTSFNISYPSSEYGEPSTTTLTLRDSDSKGASGFVRVYRDFKSSSNPGTLIGAIQVGDWYTKGYSDAISTVRVQSDSGKGNNETIELGYGGSATVRSQYIKLGESAYTNDEKITITAPSKGSYRTYMNRNGDVTDSSTAIEIDYGETVTIKAQRKLDDDSDWTSATGIKIKAPQDNKTTISSEDISPYINTGSYRVSQYQPTSGTRAEQLESNIKYAANSHQYLSFYINATVHVGQVDVTSGPKTYYCDLTSGINP